MRTLVTTGILFALLAGTVWADDAADVRAKILAAQAGISSMTLQISAPGMGMTGVGTIIRKPSPAMHMAMATGATKVDLFMVGQTLYEHLGGGPWLRMQMPDTSTMESFAKSITDKMHVTLGPDVIENGVTYGVMTTQTDTASIPGAPAVGPATMTCKYDKATFLMHSCTNGVITQTMSGYNDPANVVTLPPEALNAQSAPTPALPVPAPAASP